MPRQSSETTSHRRLKLGRSNDVLLTALVVAGFLSIFTLPAGVLALSDYALLPLANLIYLLNGIYGWRRWDSARTPAAGLFYFASQYALSLPNACATPSASKITPTAPNRPTWTGSKDQ